MGDESDEKRDAEWCSAESPGYELGAHMPYSQSVSMIEEMQARWPDHFNKISAARCRGMGVGLACGPPFHYQWYAARSNQGVVRNGSRFAWLRPGNVDMFETWCNE